MSRKITALQAQKRNPDRVNVFLDQEFAFALSRIVAAWLRVGQELSDEKIAELQAEDAQEMAYQRALNFLNYRPRSEVEVRRNLQGHRISEATIGEVIERLKRSGLLDDERFAQTWIENRSEFHPRSRRALAMEMRQHGLDSKLIDQALQSVDEEGLAYQAAAKAARRLKGLERSEFRLKLTSYLARRGFDYDAIKQAIERVWQERDIGNMDLEG